MGNEKQERTSERYLSPKDIQERLNLSRATTAKLIHTKGFPMFKVGRQIRVRESDFEKFVDTYMNHTIHV